VTAVAGEENAVADLAYVVCATPRVGSSHLCSMLSAVPGAGEPIEWFGRAMLHMRAGEWGLRAPSSERDEPRLTATREYLRRVRAAASGNGALAVKVHWNQVQWCRDWLDLDILSLYDGCQDLRYVHIWREDLVAQTVSSHIASATKVYHRYLGGADEPIEEFAGAEQAVPRYDFERMLAVLVELASLEVGWDTHFAEIGARPHRISYEDLEREPVAAVNGVLAHLGLGPAPAMASALERQRTALNDEFAERFRADLVAHAVLDALPDQVRQRCAAG
jgi:LPS sulfotransferase NodH